LSDAAFRFDRLPPAEHIIFPPTFGWGNGQQVKSRVAKANPGLNRWRTTFPFDDTIIVRLPAGGMTRWTSLSMARAGEILGS
jgi:phage tail protein X